MLDAPSSKLLSLDRASCKHLADDIEIRFADEKKTADDEIAKRALDILHAMAARRNGDIARISAYQLKDGVRLSGPNGSHIVHASNDRTIEGWRREAALVWNLTNVYDVLPIFENDEHGRQQYEELKAKSAERKHQLAV